MTKAKIIDYSSEGLPHGATLEMRGIAALLTLLYSGVWAAPMLWILSVPFPLEEYMRRLGYSPLMAAFLPIAIVVGVPVFCNVLDITLKKRSFGMRHARLGFRKADGGEVSMKDCALRAMVGLGCLPLLMVSLWIYYRHQRHWSLADQICGVIVVKM